MPREQIAYCGLNCAECEAFLATVNDDNDQRASIADAWSEGYQRRLRPEDINCDGCTAGGRLVEFCAECPVRICAVERGLQSCAQCGDYACEELRRCHERSPDARRNLERIRAARTV